MISQRDFMEIIDMKGKGYDKGHRTARLIDPTALTSNEINNLVRDIKTRVYVLNRQNPPT